MPTPSKTPVGVLFNIHEVGETTKKLWVGEFRAKETMSFRDKLNADRMRRELIGEAPGAVDREAAGAAFAISQLSVRLTETPEWWKEMKGGLELEDVNILMAVLDAAMLVEEKHLKNIEADGKAAQEALRAEGEKK